MVPARRRSVWRDRLRDGGSFVAGGAILYDQVWVETAAQPLLVGAALALMGVFAAGRLQEVLRSWVLEGDKR